jgi:basic membrane protein A and related proteins
MTYNFNRRQFLIFGSAAFGTSILLKACGASTSNNPAAEGSPAAAPGGETVKVAAVYTVPIEQQWVSRIHKAVNAAKERGDVEYVWSESVSNTDYERVMRQYAEAGHQLIIGECFAVEKACRTFAPEYPNVAFLVGSSGKPAEPNLSVFDNYIHEPSYLTGMLAGGMTKSNVIGMVGGYPIPEVNRLMNAFMAGAQEINPDVKFLVTFIGSWFDPPKAKEAAFAQIDAGADILYAERFGVSDAAKERQVLAIGNVIDTQKDYPETVVASALWHMEPTIDQAIAAVKSGNFKPEDYGQYSYMKHKGSSLSDLGTFADKVPADLQDQVKQRQEEILAGSFTVKVDDNEPKSNA